jgi:hypothetical protein
MDNLLMRDWAEREAESGSKKVLLSSDPVHGERRMTGESWSRYVVEDVCEVDGHRASSRRDDGRKQKKEAATKQKRARSMSVEQLQYMATTTDLWR